MTKRVQLLFIFFRLLFGVFFIFSAVLKLNPIEFFEFTFVETDIFSFSQAAIAARLFIGLEFLLGALLIFGFRQKNTLRFARVLLLFLTVYVLHLAFTQGLNASCRCLGDHFQMTPLVSLTKNIALIIGISLMIHYEQPVEKFALLKWFSFLSFPVAFILPFILNPVTTNLFIKQPGNFESYPFPIENLEGQDFHGSTNPNFEKGKHLVAVYLAGCRFCRIAMHKLALMDKKHDLPKITIISSGDATYVQSLFGETQSAYDFYIINTNDLMILNGSRAFPGILYVKNGEVVYRWRGSTFHENYVLAVIGTQRK